MADTTSPAPPPPTPSPSSSSSSSSASRKRTPPLTHANSKSEKARETLKKQRTMRDIPFDDRLDAILYLQEDILTIQEGIFNFLDQIATRITHIEEKLEEKPPEVTVTPPTTVPRSCMWTPGITSVTTPQPVSSISKYLESTGQPTPFSSFVTAEVRPTTPMTTPVLPVRPTPFITQLKSSLQQQHSSASQPQRRGASRPFVSTPYQCGNIGEDVHWRFD